MVILVDMDDTIEDLLTPWLNILNNRYGLSVNRDQVTEWDMRKTFPMLSDYEIYSPLESDELWESVNPLPGARRYLQKLMIDGHEIYIVTSSHYSTLKTKMEKCLFRCFPYIAYDNVIVTSKKRLINGDVLIDDNPSNLVDSRCWCMLMDAPYNRSFDANYYNILRVNDWDEIYKAINSMSAIRRNLAWLKANMDWRSGIES